MVWLAICSKGLSPLVIIENNKLNSNQYIQKILPVAVKFGNNHFGNDWTFQ